MTVAIKYARSLSLVAVLALCGACSSDESTPAAPDADPIDTGIAPDSGVFADAEPADSGVPPDTGEPPDSGEVFPDAEPPDMGFVPDTGVLGVCPEPSNFPDGTPDCTRAADCTEDLPPPTNCDFCRPFNEALCTMGACSSPALLGLNERVVVVFDATGLESELRSFAGIVVDAETSGGLTIDCDDVYSPTWDLAENCYNWVDTRFAVNLGQPAQSFPFRFGRFPGGRRVLLLVYGFDRDNARGAPVGVTCTAVDVHQAGTRTEDLMVAGDRMRQLP